MVNLEHPGAFDCANHPELHRGLRGHILALIVLVFSFWVSEEFIPESQTRVFLLVY